MTATVPQTPRTLVDLKPVLLSDPDVIDVDLSDDSDDDSGCASTWAEIVVSSITVPQSVIDELSRARGRFEMYSVDRENGHATITVLEVGR